MSCRLVDREGDRLSTHEHRFDDVRRRPRAGEDPIAYRLPYSVNT